jgi:hypothetical protein
LEKFIKEGDSPVKFQILFLVKKIFLEYWGFILEL